MGRSPLPSALVKRRVTLIAAFLLPLAAGSLLVSSLLVGIAEATPREVPLTPRAAVEPELLNFGGVELNVTVELDFHVYNQGDPGTVIEVTELRLLFGNGYFALVDPPATPFTLLGGEGRAITVSFTPIELGPHHGRVRLAVVGDPQVELLHVELAGNGIEEQVPPIASAGGPYMGVAEFPLQLDGTASFDPNGDPLTYLWEFGDGATSAAPAPVHAYAAAGLYSVILTVHDGHQFGADTTAAEIEPNLAPVATAGGPYTGHTNVPLAFDGSASSDPNGQPLTYAWSFGDGATAAGAMPVHIYVAAGMYTVTLVVSDSLLTDTDITTATIELNEPPVAHAGGPYTGAVCDGIQFDGSGSFDPDGDPLTYYWSYGDGSTGYGPFAGHVYLGPGLYTVVLEVGDPFFADSDTTYCDITPPAPAVVVSTEVDAGAAGPTVPMVPPALRDGDCLASQGAEPDARYGIQGTWPTQGPCTSGCPGDPAGLIGLAIPLESCTTGFVKQTRVLFQTGELGDRYHLYLWRDAAGLPNDACGLECAVGYGQTLQYDAPSLEVVAWTDSCPCQTFEGERLYVGLVYVDDGAPPDWRLAREALPGLSGMGYMNLSGTHGDWIDTEQYGFGSRWAVEQVVGPECEPIPPGQPIADAGGPYATIEGEAVVLDASGSWDPNGDPLAFAWEFGDGTTGEGRTVEHFYASAGIYDVLLTVDDGGLSDQDSTFVDVAVNQPPVAAAGGPYQGVACEPVSFDGSGSFDPEGHVITYLWDFGDGLIAAGVAPTHDYQGTGIFTVLLTVSDSVSATTDTTTATIVPPSGGPAPAGLPLSPLAHVVPHDVHFGVVNVGEAAENYFTITNVGELGTTLTVADLQLGGHAAFTLVDPPALPLELPVCSSVVVTVRFAPPVAGVLAGEVAVHTNDPGSPVIIVTLDGEGLGPMPPVASAGGPYVGNLELPVAFDGTGSFDPNGDPLTYLWQFGDGATGASATPEHLYPVAGLYTVVLTVSDGGFTAADTTTAEIVENLLPVADAGGPYSGARGEFICLDGTGSYDPEGLPITYQWSFGDGDTGEGATPGHIYVTTGQHVVILTVFEGQDSAADTTSATIFADPPGAGTGSQATLEASPGGEPAPEPVRLPPGYERCLSTQGAVVNAGLGIAGCWPPQTECQPGSPGEPGKLIGLAFPLESCQDGYVFETRVNFFATEPGDFWRLVIWRDLGGVPEDACGLECGETYPLAMGNAGPTWESFDWATLSCPCVTYESERLYVGALYFFSGTPADWQVGREDTPGHVGMGFANFSGEHGDWVDLHTLGYGNLWGVENEIAWDCGATPVVLHSFTAAVAAAGIELRWSAGITAGLLGFHVERAGAAAGPWARLTTAYLANRPYGSYTYLDADAARAAGSPGGEAWYRLVAVYADGAEELYGPVSAAGFEVLPAAVALLQNVPNPLNPTTTILYDLPQQSPVSLKIYDSRGRLVRVLKEGVEVPGRRAAVWDGRDVRGRQVGSGVYLCELRAGETRLTRKLLVLR